MTRTIRFALAAVVFASGAALAGPPQVAGKATVIDGDTITVNRTTVRLKGVDAPEIGTAAGKSAKRAMIELIGKEVVRCELTGEKTHKREVGFCTTESGFDLNGGIIDLGMALACPRYSEKYVDNEQPVAVETLERSSYCEKQWYQFVDNPKANVEDSYDDEDVEEVRPAPRKKSRKAGVVCMYPDDVDRAGRRCGARAASVRPGGY